MSLLQAAAGAQECAGEENRLLSGHLHIPGAKLAFAVFQSAILTLLIFLQLLLGATSSLTHTHLLPLTLWQAACTPLCPPLSQNKQEEKLSFLHEVWLSPYVERRVIFIPSCHKILNFTREIKILESAFT